jgi:hypothetical protein
MVTFLAVAALAVVLLSELGGVAALTEEEK